MKAWEIIDIPAWIQDSPRPGFEREPVPLSLRNMGKEIWKCLKKKISGEIFVILRHIALCRRKEGNMSSSC